MEKSYRYIYLFFVFILLLAPIGFKRYITKLIYSENIDWLLHIHTILMLIWCIILIIQPILITKRKNKIHKSIGKFSFGFFPLLSLSIMSVIFYSFDRMIPVLNVEENLAQIFLPISQLVLFVVFYVLAIINVNKPHLHMRYVIISSISLFGPTIGRINFGLKNFNADLWFMNLCVLFFLFLKFLKKVFTSLFYMG